MKRTRRAALAMIAGSSSLLAVDTLSYTSARVDRELDVDVVPDDEAYLALTETEDGETVEGDLVFEETVDAAVRCFTVQNRLHDTITVTLTAAGGSVRFATGDDDCPCGGSETVDLPGIEPGATRRVAVSLADPTSGTGDVVGLSARTDDGSVVIDADRTITLEDAYALVVWVWPDPETYVTVRKRESGRCVLEVLKDGERVFCKVLPSLWAAKKHLLTIHLRHKGGRNRHGGFATSRSGRVATDATSGAGSGVDVDPEIVTVDSTVLDAHVSGSGSRRPPSTGIRTTGSPAATIDVEFDGEGDGTRRLDPIDVPVDG